MITRGPLGLLPDFSVDMNTLSKLDYVEKFDMSDYKRFVVENHGPTAIDIELAEREFKRFLALPLLFREPDYAFVPTYLIDALWHHFILDTPTYRAFCDATFGGYLDHVPSSSRAKGKAKLAGEPVAYTKRCIRQAFGAPPPAIWGESVDCDTGACAGKCLPFPPD